MPEKGKRAYPLVETTIPGGPQGFDLKKMVRIDPPKMVGDWHSVGYLIGHTKEGRPLLALTLEAPGGPGLVRELPHSAILRVIEKADTEPGPTVPKAGLYNRGVYMEDK